MATAGAALAIEADGLIAEGTPGELKASVGQGALQVRLVALVVTFAFGLSWVFTASAPRPLAAPA